jgi:hypothetical protein
VTGIGKTRNVELVSKILLEKNKLRELEVRKVILRQILSNVKVEGEWNCLTILFTVGF